MTLSVNDSNQYVVFTMDSGTKPTNTWKYEIQRKETGQASSYYYTITKTSDATYTDHPRPTNASGTQITWDYRVRPYIFGTGWSTWVEETGVAISSVNDTQISNSGVLSTATSSGNMNNTYLAQGETKPSGSTNLDENTWVVTEILPLTVSSA